MNLMGLGLNLKGEALFKPVDAATAAKELVAALRRTGAAVERVSVATQEAASFRGEVQRATRDLGDPRTAGWTFLINRNDPRRTELEQAVRPLALHRGMADPQTPLLYDGEPSDAWFDWMNDTYYALQLEGKVVPQYILILGGPDQVPFGLQSILDTVANVGRLDFDTEDGLQPYNDYIQKLIRLENAPDPLVNRQAILFGPDGGYSDPTYFSRRYMVQPLRDHIRDDLGFETQLLVKNQATKARLVEALSTQQPALVYTASHGLGAIEETEDIQRRYNGAICCQHSGELNLDHLFSAEDVPMDRPFLEGAVFFQFACFGYGTPAESDFTHWLTGLPEHYTHQDFVAALPKRLLAHPRGPVAFIGHLDTAFLHGFSDAESPYLLDRWHNRIEPFVSAVDGLLAVQPSGLVMQDMNARYAICNTLISSTYDREKRGKLTWNPQLEARFLDTWITRSDAQNYMVLGDPAAHLRIPAP